MTTKAGLEKENGLLRDLVKPKIEVRDSTFIGSSSEDQCRAIGKIADALKEAAIALQGRDTLVHFGDKHYHGG